MGNSRTKWRTLEADGGGVLGRGVAGTLDDLAGQLDEALAGQPLGMARGCSVLGKEATAAVAGLLRGRFRRELRLAQVSRCWAGVTNQYADLQSLGVDRWLAMLAAFRQGGGGACVVVDGGSALTVDVVDGAGLHRGGYIVPGQSMMRDSLVSNTRIRLLPPSGPPTKSTAGAGALVSLAPPQGGSDGSANISTEGGAGGLGISTDGAVRGGCLAAALALIERVVLAQLAQQQPSSPQQKKAQSISLLITGGDGGVLREGLEAGGRLPPGCVVSLNPDLVLDGLALALPVAAAP